MHDGQAASGSCTPLNESVNGGNPPPTVAITGAISDLGGEGADVPIMLACATLALGANLACLRLLWRFRAQT